MTAKGDLRRGLEVLGHLMTVNTGLGHAIRRMHEYESAHGHLPPDTLRVLSGLLQEIVDELTEYADSLVQRSTEMRFKVEEKSLMSDKHTGEDDTQTDHTDKGSDGHTTVSGEDK